MILHSATTTKAARNGFTCSVCNSTHSPGNWGVAYQLTETGALYATA